MKSILRLAVLVLVTAVCGCNGLQPAATEAVAVPVPGVALHGSVFGGSQAIGNAVVQMYTVGTASDGSASKALGTSTTTLANGSFSITSNYTCPSTTANVYLVAVGGNPGLMPSTANNPQITLMAAIGACGTPSNNTKLTVNEATTVAAVWALAPYMTSYTAVGSGTSDAAALSSAFTLANEFVSLSTGTSPGASVPTGYTVPTAEIYGLADMLAACVNSSGGTAGQSNACGSLMTAATPSGSSAPTETIGAALDIAKNPNQNVPAVFGIIPTSGPFQPVLTYQPADWTVPLLPTSVTRILFVGDSFTHGRYLPVRTYNNTNDTDENYGLPSSNSRAESSTEPGPYGGIPGIFKMFTTEAGLNYDVHVEAISSTSLATHYSVASAVIADQEWNAVVLQEISTRPLPPSLSGDSTSNPSNFCSSVKTIEKGVHAVNPTANIYLYETWARADEAENLGSSTYSTNLTNLFTSYHNVFYRAAVLDGNIAGVAATGDAWQLAINNGVAMSNPYTSSTGPFLWYGINATNNPTITSADEYHPSIYGAYLSALVLYGQITGQDPALLGATEQAAATLGISTTMAVQLQQIAHTQVYSGSTAPINQSTDPCTVT